jgi:phycobilisome core-membrane linker protein
MAKALRSSGKPQGFAKRGGLSRPQELPVFPSEVEFQQVIDGVYRQLLNRLPLAAERLGDAESQLRNGGLSVADFVARVAASDLFERRLNRMAPLRAATAAHMALLGRAAQADETSRFLATRVSKGLAKAIDDLLNSADYANSFGRDGVPYVAGLDTQDGIPLSTVNRTASLYGGNAALNPPSRGAI